MSTQDKTAQALRLIKDHVCGNRVPRWSTDEHVFASREAIANLCDEALAEHEAQAQAVPDSVQSTIGKLLADAMSVAVSNGANSVSMPDEYVELAAWLAAAPQPEAIPSVNFRGARRRDAAEATLKHLGYEWCGGELWKPPLGKAPGSALAAQQAEHEPSDDFVEGFKMGAMPLTDGRVLQIVQTIGPAAVLTPGTIYRVQGMGLCEYLRVDVYLGEHTFEFRSVTHGGQVFNVSPKHLAERLEQTP